MTTTHPPDPALALRHLADAAKALAPGLTDGAIARKLGVSPPAFSDWCNRKEIPRSRHRRAMVIYFSKIAEELRAGFDAVDEAEVAQSVTPFTPSSS